MKKILLPFLLLTSFSIMGFAQKGKQNKQVKTTPVKARIAQRNKPVVLNSASSYAAFSNAISSTRFTIFDPTIRWYNARSSDVRKDPGNSVFGIPKLSNGLAHGRILFQPTGASTSGSYTGSGGVGTGSSIGNIGTNPASLGVNGKNPYAGPGIYGTRVLSDIRSREQATNAQAVKQKD